MTSLPMLSWRKYTTSLLDHFVIMSNTPVIRKQKGSFVIWLILGLAHNIENYAFIDEGEQGQTKTTRKWLQQKVQYM